MSRDLLLIRHGVVAGLRNPGLRLLGLVSFLGVGAAAWGHGSLAGTFSIQLTNWLGRGFGVAAALWFAYSAIRDQDERTGAMLRSKPVDGARWVTLNWATGMCVWLFLMLLPCLGAAIGQFPAAGFTSVASHAVAFGRAAMTLLTVGTLSFMLSRMMRSPLGGVLTVFAWFCTMAGARYVPTTFQPDFSQNRLLFLGLCLFVFALCALGMERWRRGEMRQPAVPIAAVLGSLLLTGAGLANANSRQPNMATGVSNIWDRITLQHARQGERAPGFWLPDGRGGLVRTAPHAGKILLIFIFAADDMEAAQTLPALDQIAREYADRGVQPIGVCLAQDHGDGWTLARMGGYRFPIGMDLATVKTSIPPESAITTAYDIQVLPRLVITDRRHLIREQLSEATYSIEYLRQQVGRRLTEEPR